MDGSEIDDIERPNPLPHCGRGGTAREASGG